MTLVSRIRVGGIGLLLLSTLACEEEKINRAPSAGSGSATPALDRKAMAAGSSSAAPATPGLPKADFQDIEFGESERSRDPFRSYEESFIEESRSTARSQRKVVLSEFGVDELKLVGIITGIPDARAMLVDPQGTGHVVHRGQLIGRAEIVHGDGQGAPAFEVNWRIDRIRDGDIVLVREDPKNPEVPSATRVVPLHQDANAKLQSQGPE